MSFMIITLLFAEMVRYQPLMRSVIQTYHLSEFETLSEAVRNRRGTQQNTALRWDRSKPDDRGFRFGAAMDGALLHSEPKAQSLEADPEVFRHEPGIVECLSPGGHSVEWLYKPSGLRVEFPFSLSNHPRRHPRTELD